MSNLSTLPKGDSAWLLRKAIERIIQQVSVLETNIGASTSGNSTNTQIIFNDNGTLRGDAGLVYNKTTDALTVAGLVTAGSATITGDLTVRTNKLAVTSTGVGIGMTPITPLSGVIGTTGAVFFRTTDPAAAVATPYIQAPVSTGFSSASPAYGFWYQACGIGNPALNNVSIITDSAERYKIDSTGVSTWSVAGTTAMTLNSTGLGIGTAPANVITARAAQDTGLELNSAASNASRLIFAYDPANTRWYINSTLSGSGTTLPLAFLIGNTERMRIDTSGNVGIGVTPSAWLSSLSALQVKGVNGLYGAGSSEFGSVQNCFYNASSQWIYGTTAAAGKYAISSGVHQWYNAPSGTAGNAITFTQAMTLDASGNLLVGTPSAVASGSTFQNLGTARQVLTLKGNDATSYTLGIWSATTTGDNLFAYFGTEASLTVRGGISYNRGGGLIAYNTTSDYRAKDIIGPVSNSGSLIDSLKVYVGKMKGATIARPMLIAHEAQEVAPYAVTGTKDEVDAEGKPKYQQMDASALVPLLIAEIQSLRARVQTLEAR